MKNRLFPVAVLLTALGLAAWTAPALKPPKIMSETNIVKTMLVPALHGIASPDAVEVRLWDRSRVDFMTDDYAFEVDWSKKWAEGVGQALFYGRMTGKKPGLFLLVKDIDDERHFIYRARVACDAAGVALGVYDVTRRGIRSAPMFGMNPNNPW